MSEPGSGSYGHVSGGDSPGDREDEDGVVRHDCLVRTLLGHSHAVWAVATDGTYVVSGSSDRTVKLWDLASGVCVRTLVGHTATVWSVALSPACAYIVSGGSDNTVKLWDLASGACVRTLAGHWDTVYSATYSPDGRHLVSGSQDDTIKIWDGRHYRRVPHCLIRNRVRATQAAVSADVPLLQRQLLTYVYCNDDGDGETLLDDLFPLVIQFLVG